MPPHTTKRRTKKKNNQPELTENQTVWKSDNQGVKEETFIQTSRSSGDRQLGQRGLTARQCLEDKARWLLEDWGRWSRQSHIFMQINWEEQLGSKTDHTTQSSSAEK